MLKEYPSPADLVKFSKAKLRKEKRKAIKKGLKVEDEPVIGNWFVAKTVTGLVPYNQHGTTTYLVGSGITVLAEKTKSGFRIYLTVGRTITTKKQLADLVERKVIKKPVIARRCELNIIKPFSFVG